VPERQDVHLVVVLSDAKRDVIPDPPQEDSPCASFLVHRLPNQVRHVCETFEELLEILIERERCLVAMFEPPISRRLDLRGGFLGDP